jgi:hypothetical protein
MQQVDKKSAPKQGDFQAIDNEEENFDIPSCFRKKK